MSTLGEVVLRSQPPDQPFIAFFLHEGRLQAALVVNQTHELRALKRLIATGATPEPKVLANEDMPLKSLGPTTAEQAGT